MTRCSWAAAYCPDENVRTLATHAVDAYMATRKMEAWRTAWGLVDSG